MAQIVVDFAWSKPTVSQLKGWNAVAVGMYVSHDSNKSANAQVIEEYSAAGIRTFLFFEDAGGRATGGYAAGRGDAAFAYSFAAKLGKPAWAPVIPAIDFDVPDYAPNSSDAKEKLGPVGEYCRAWHDFGKANGVIADTAYGDYYVIERLAKAGLLDIGVQTVAWSGGQVDLQDIALLQTVQSLDQGQVDIETIESGTLLSHLAWIPGERSPMATPTAPVPDAIPDPPPGAWHDRSAWDWTAVSVVGIGHDGRQHIFTLGTDGHWHKAE